MADENILVELDYQNIVVVDPNKTIDDDGNVNDRLYAQEDMVMYANLEAQLLPRTKLVTGQPLDDAIKNVKIATVNFMRPGGKDFLTNEYTDELTGKDSLEGKGLNQKQKGVIQDQKKPADFYVKQQVLNNVDTELLGIEQIVINNDRSNTPTVNMTLIDINGRALFEKGDESPYACFFNLPYPTFYLTVKGYVGKAIRYQLILAKFAATFDGSTGNYRIDLTFYAYKYTILADTTVGSLFALPLMYKTKYEVSTNAPQTPQQVKAQSQVGQNNENYKSVITNKGRQKLDEVYSKYKELNLIDANFPQLSLSEFVNRLDSLESNIIASFGQEDFSPLTDIDSYYRELNEYSLDVFSNEPNTFFTQYIDKQNYFIGQDGSKIYVFNKVTNETIQNKNNALTELKRIIDSYTKTLAQNTTCGENGSFTIGSKTISSKVTNRVNYGLVVIEPGSRPINWVESYKIRFGRDGLTNEVNEFESANSGTTSVNQINSIGGVQTKNVLFVFEGPNSFQQGINDMISDLTKTRQRVEELLQKKLAEKLEGDNGLGFKPTIRNLFAVVFASIEGFYRLMDDVHRDAWAQRFNRYRKNAILAPEKSSVGSEGKDFYSKINTQKVDEIPVYPWPQYFVETNIDGEERYELRYPGEPSEVSITKGNDFTVWPEVQFVEEYIKALTERLETNEPNGDSNESETILRISLNAVEFPLTNTPYTDKEEVKYFYEIYERVLLHATIQRLSKTGTLNFELYKTVADMETKNIVGSLNESNPYLSKKLKEFALNGGNYINFLRTISNEGTGLNFQSFIRGLYNTRYIRGYTEQDFSIMSVNNFLTSTNSSSENVDSVVNVNNYLGSSVSKETDLLDVIPFIDESWSSNNLQNGINDSPNRYTSSRSIAYNEDKKVVSNYFPNKGIFLNSSESLTNRPFTDFNYKNVENPLNQLSNTLTGDFETFYTDRNVSKVLLPTEGLLGYNPINYLGAVDVNQTVSMLNTPYFINSIQTAAQRIRTGNNQTPFVESAYLFLNSLPLATLSEKYKSLQIPEWSWDSDPSNVIELDYIFATMKKFGGAHKLPYAWILKYGSIWHRYKTFVQTGTDILTPIWTDTDYVTNYDPQTANPEKVYTFTASNITYDVTLQQNITGISPQTNIDVGFYPYLYNDVFYLMSGLNLFTDYSNTDIQNTISVGLNLGYSLNSSINLPQGFDPLTPTRTLRFRPWYATFDTNNLDSFTPNLQFKTLVLPSFGSTIQQITEEIFIPAANSFILRPNQEVINNRAIFNATSRSFWAAPNFGYYDLTSVSQPPYDGYIKEIYNNTATQDSFKVGTSYSKIEDVFGTYKKEILDLFENEFLKFSRDIENVDVEDSDVQNTNFHYLLREILSVPQVNFSSDADTYITRVQDAQLLKIGNVVNTLLSYDKVFKFGNPGEYNRRVFGTFTTPQIIDPITSTSYIVGSLPTNGGTTTLVVSQANNPQAWSALRQYVGFSTIPELAYSNNGSYYTDFFVNNNIAFTQENVINFAPLIKIYGTQKYINNGTYNSATFNTDITGFVDDKNAYVGDVLNQLFISLQRQLPDIEQIEERPINSSLQGSQMKIEYWETFKAFNDRWIAGNDFKDKTLFEDVMFLDRANRDIGDKVYFDIFGLKSYLFPANHMNARVIDFLSKMITMNKFFMMPMAAYINYWGINDIRPNSQPVAEGSNEFANSLFGTFTEVDYRESSPKIVCFYAGKPSEHLDLRRNVDYRFRSDSFDLARIADTPFLEKLIDKRNWSTTNKVVGFNVDFGTRNQGMFYNIVLEQNSGAATTEANQVMTETSNAAGGRKSFTQSTSLYNLYKNRSYTCSIESLGNAMIQPTMYFNLRHVPMFNGAYMIQSVRHNIEAGQFRTYFSGVRMPVYSLPKINDQIATINQNLLNNLVTQIQRRKSENETTGLTSNNVISAGNTITASQQYQRESSSTCLNNILANPNYSRYEGVESVLTEMNFKDFSNALRNATTDPRVRAIVFYVAYLNGIKDNKFIAYNNNLGGIMLGGPQFETIKWGGNLSNLFQNNYFCLSDSNKIIRPYATFSTLENSINFLVSYFSGKVTDSVTVGFVNYPNAMIGLYIKWWPTLRFNTNEEIIKWDEKNPDSVKLLDEKAKQVFELLKKNNLL